VLSFCSLVVRRQATKLHTQNKNALYPAGVSAAYNLSTYAQEKRRCLVQWAEHVLAIVEGRDSVIVPMKRA
jgi:hypothetical protein